MDAIQLSKIIENYFIKNKIEKTLALLNELRTGKYYHNSKLRTNLIGNYKGLVANLLPEEYIFFKNKFLSELNNIIEDRNQRKIAYITLSQLIEFSCSYDKEIFNEYEKQIFKLATSKKQKYLFHIISLAQTRMRVIGNIDNVEDFFIEKYLQPSRLNTIHYRNLLDFTVNVSNSNKRKLLTHLFKIKPFKNDFIIKTFILQNDELKKLGSLI